MFARIVVAEERKQNIQPRTPGLFQHFKGKISRTDIFPEETTRDPPMRIKAAAAASCTPGFSSLRPSMRGSTAWD
jgi:hypothetical protein